MCDHEHYKDLDERVDDIDRRLTAVETGMKDFRDETRQGFKDVKDQLNHLYAERSEWGKMGRDIVRKVVTWLMWLIPALVGLRYVAGKFMGATP